MKFEILIFQNLKRNYKRKGTNKNAEYCYKLCISFQSQKNNRFFIRNVKLNTKLKLIEKIILKLNLNFVGNQSF